MGITGLIPFLEKASSKLHLKDIRGSTVAVDTYCWLHKGVFACAEKLVRGEDTDQYIQYCLKYVQLLLSFDIKPILVFDGRHLPAKALTEQRRREARKESKKRAAELLRAGQIEEARSHMRRCVDVTHQMALRLIKECRLRNVDCIVAPYEADAQMAWFSKVELAQYVITEDSDLTLFGARQIIFKLDLTGVGLLVQADKLYLAMGCKPEKYTFEKFRRMCILSGCDYLDSLPGIGLAKACKFFLKTEETDMWRSLKKIPGYLNMRNLQVDDEYIDKFLKAEATFKHMYIYNPLKRRQERLHELHEFGTEERYCSNAGKLLADDELALQLALGNIEPFTLKAMDNWHPDQHAVVESTNKRQIKRAKHKSIWQQNYATKTAPQRTAAANQGAFHFKKLNFNAKTMQTDDLIAETDKPEESDIYTMYQQQQADTEPANKRARCNSIEVSPKQQQQQQNLTHHNPFAKVNATTPEQKSPICANASLLKVLSPSKCKIEMERQSLRLNRLRRSIFSTKALLEQQQKTQTEVKSRFFATHCNMAMNETANDLTAEIEQIETLKQQTQQTQQQLYSPSPKKQKSRLTAKLTNKQQQQEEEALSASHADSGIESLGDADAQNLTITIESNSNALKPLELETLSIDSDVAIEISDEDASMHGNTFTQTQRLQRFSAAPRLGLTRTTSHRTMPKTAGKKLQRSTGNSASNEGTARQSQTQTRLSMFGFKKKPSLK